MPTPNPVPRIVPRRRLALTLLCLLMVALAPLAAEEPETPPAVPDGVRGVRDSLFHDALTAGQALVIHDRYEAAVAHFDSLRRRHPGHPAPHFYLAAVYQNWMATFRFNTYRDTLESLVETAIRLGENLRTDRPDDPWIPFYAGGAYGYSAFFKMLDWNFIGAYRDGLKGIDRLRTALDMEPRLYDVYLGLGTYYYWRTARSRFVRFIAFWMSDERERGLELLRFARDHGRYSEADAALALAVSLYDFERYEAALAVLDEFRRAVPHPLMSELYYRGRTLQQLGQWEGVEAAFLPLLRELDARPYSGDGYKAECLYWIAMARQRTGRSGAARDALDRAFVLTELRDEDRELDGPFENFGEIRKGMEQLRDELE